MAITKQILADLIILNPKHKDNTVSKLMRLTKDKLLAECTLLGIELPTQAPKKDKAVSKPRAKKVVDNSTQEKRNLTSSRSTKKENDKGDFVSWRKAQRWTKAETGEYVNDKGVTVPNMDALFGIFAAIR